MHVDAYSLFCKSWYYVVAGQHISHEAVQTPTTFENIIEGVLWYLILLNMKKYLKYFEKHKLFHFNLVM